VAKAQGIQTAAQRGDSSGMSKENTELSELMGWKYEERQLGKDCKLTSWWGPKGINQLLPAYNTDLNAMREVWKVIYEKGQWGEFLKAWDLQDNCHALKIQTLFYRMPTDLPGQVKAAIKVLKK